MVVVSRIIDIGSPTDDDGFWPPPVGEGCVGLLNVDTANESGSCVELGVDPVIADPVVQSSAVSREPNIEGGSGSVQAGLIAIGRGDGIEFNPMRLSHSQSAVYSGYPAGNY